MRHLQTHKVNGLNEALDIKVLDEPGAGGACHEYCVTWDVSDNSCMNVLIPFQKGPIMEHGVNGLSQEALLAILIDRLEHFQAGPYACGENAQALSHCHSALSILKARTVSRVSRNVEGTSAL